MNEQKIQELKEQIERSKQNIAAHEEKSRGIFTRLDVAEKKLSAIQAEMLTIKAKYRHKDYDRIGDPDKLKPLFAVAERREKAAETELHAIKGEMADHDRMVVASPADIQRQIFALQFDAAKEELAGPLKDAILHSFALFRLANGMKSFAYFFNAFFDENLLETGHAFDKECTARADLIRREEVSHD